MKNQWQNKDRSNNFSKSHMILKFDIELILVKHKSK